MLGRFKCTSYGRFIESNQRYRFVDSNVSTTDINESQMCQPRTLSKIKRANYRRYAESNVSTTDVTKLKSVDRRRYVK
jgi:hypothetical protein